MQYQQHCRRYETGTRQRKLYARIDGSMQKWSMDRSKLVRRTFDLLWGNPVYLNATVIYIVLGGIKAFSLGHHLLQMLEFSIMPKPRDVTFSDCSIIRTRMPDSLDRLGQAHIIGLKLVETDGHNHCRQVQQPTGDFSSSRMLVDGDIINDHGSLLG